MTENATGHGSEELSDWVATTFLDTADTGQVPVQAWKLSPVISKPPFLKYWKDVWDHRGFIWANAKARAFQTTRGTVLGKIWLVLSPFLNAMIFYVIFGLLLKISRGVPNFLGYLVIGILFFPVVQDALSSGSQALLSSRNLVRAFSFPRAAVVMSWSIRSMLDFIPIFLAALLFITVVPPHVAPTPLWLLAIPVLFLGFVFANGLALLTSSITAGLPDMKFIWPLLGRFWFYVSGVFFALDRFEHIFLLSLVMQANPAYVFLTMLRDVLIYQTFPSAFAWAYMSVWAFGIWIVGAVVFWWREEKYAEELQ